MTEKIAYENALDEAQEYLEEQSESIAHAIAAMRYRISRTKAQEKETSENRKQRHVVEKAIAMLARFVEYIDHTCN